MNQGPKRRQCYDDLQNASINRSNNVNPFNGSSMQQSYAKGKRRKEVRLHSVPWYHGPITREVAEELLQPFDDGFFLIRESVTYRGGFTLSVCADKFVQHYRIIYANSKYSIDEEIFFDRLEDLVDHYANDADGIVHRLVSYPPKAGVPIYPPVLEYFNKEGWVIPFEEIHLGQKLGSGDFASVYRAICRDVTVAAKCVKQESSMSFYGLKEASMMTSLNHVNLVRLFGISICENSFYLVCEYLPNGSLVDFLRSRGKSKIEMAHVITFSMDICAGMTQLERQKVVHRDLAARNVLLDADCRAKIADFGHCRESNSQEHKGRMPIKWTAPEAIKNNIFTPASDMWSYGVLLWEIFTFGKLPYSTMQVKDVLDNIEEGYRLPMPEDCPSMIYELMHSAWNILPEKRPSFFQCMDKWVNLYQILLPGVPLPSPPKAPIAPPDLY
ncbi:hypothetical protein Ciccas_010004 [Cichlidogyrus casuarinus]|uniref:Tyrosine-protein kinase n=1 Tax=Cichlidogyrus casuarinus TaxID=1844966 RepID=A0ABD2PVD4_9PLAT